MQPQVQTRKKKQPQVPARATIVEGVHTNQTQNTTLSSVEPAYSTFQSTVYESIPIQPFLDGQSSSMYPQINTNDVQPYNYYQNLQHHSQSPSVEQTDFESTGLPSSRVTSYDVLDSNAHNLTSTRFSLTDTSIQSDGGTFDSLGITTIVPK
jgi:hypothetical protein